jgi:hypothetical protein
MNIFKLICKYVKHRLLKDFRVNKLVIPRNATAKTPKSYILHSADFGTNKKLMIIIPDKGDYPPLYSYLI